MEATQIEAGERTLNNKIHFPTADEEKAALDEFFSSMTRVRRERRSAMVDALQALPRLIEVMRNRTGQSYKVRDLMYSLWNGKPASLIEVMNLDWDIRTDLCKLILAFGFEDATAKLWYNEISAALRAARQFEWFVEASGNED